jgi:hypothetical protein
MGDNLIDVGVSEKWWITQSGNYKREHDEKRLDLAVPYFRQTHLYTGKHVIFSQSKIGILIRKSFAIYCMFFVNNVIGQ